MSDRENAPDSAAKQPAIEALAPLIDAGHELIPLNGKAPAAKGWRWAKPLSPEAAIDRLELCKGNVGVRLRQADLVVDVDPRNFDEGDDPVARLERDLGVRLSDWLTTVTGSGGSHHFMRVEPGQSFRNSLDAYPGVEFKAYGRQVVAPGSTHPETGRSYASRRPDPLDERIDAPENLLELIRRPVGASEAEPGILAPDELAELLGLLDSVDFGSNDLWFPVMAASHHATAGDGLEEFLAWSAGDAGYAGHEAKIAARWGSLHADGSDRRITAGSLAELLRQKGHREAGDALSLKIDEAARTDPADEFPDDLDDLPDFIREAQARDTVLDRVNADRFTVLTGGKYLVGRESIDPRTKAFSVEWYSPDAVKQHMNARSVETPEGKRVPLGTWWTGHPQRRQYDGVIFDPTPGASHPGWYNLWRGWAVEPMKGDWSKMQQLIRDVLCRGDQESYDYVVRWMAHMVQHPSRPAEVALVFKGRKGSGKGTLCRALVELAGKHGRHVSNAGQFTGRFNEHLADTILLFVDEGFWAGDKSAEGTLKALITEKTLTFEGKGKPIVQGPNQLHVVMASNEDWVVPATADERRFAVFEADEDAARVFPHFAALIEEDGQSGAERRRILSAMLCDLLTMDLGGWHPRKDIPQTDALAAQKVEGFRSDPLAFWWHRCLEDGRIGYVGEPDEWVGPIDAESTIKEHMVDAVNAQARAMGRKGEFTKHKVAQFLARVGVDVKARDRKANRVWAVPSLEVARERFEAWLGAPINWPD